MGDNYSEAERLVLRADGLLETAAAEHGEEAAQAGFYMAMARAQGHATLALVDVLIEVRDEFAHPKSYRVQAPNGADIPVSPASAPEHRERH